MKTCPVVTTHCSVDMIRGDFTLPAEKTFPGAVHPKTETMHPGSNRGSFTGSIDLNSASSESTVAVTWHRFPHSLVWTPIPVLTWLFPFIGHLGITNTAGVIFDFAAPYTINEDCMAFGWPTMYYQLDLSKVESRDAWDRAVHEANELYKMRVHNLCFDNCHHHVVHALNTMRYGGKSDWNMVSVLLHFFVKGRYVSPRHCMASWFPFLLLTALAVIIALIVVLR